MSNLKNRVQLIGNLGNTPEIMNFDGGKKLAKYSLATNEFHKTSDGSSNVETVWHNIISWGKLAEISEKYLEKGSEVLIEGKLTYNTFEDKNGIKRRQTEIVVIDLQMLGKPTKS